MPAPAEITYASRNYEAFAADLTDAAMLQTHNQVYAMTRAVLHAFRDRLAVADAIAFAQGLPAVLRAIYVEGWSGGDAPVSFGGAEAFRADLWRP